MTTVSEYFTENTGGGCMVDFVILSDNTLISLNDKLAIKWQLPRRGMNKTEIINFWYDAFTWDKTQDTSKLLKVVQLASNPARYNNTWNAITTMHHCHSFPNNKIFTIYKDSINLDTLEAYILKEK